MSSWKTQIEALLEGSGIVINGPNPWDPQVHDERFYKRVLTQGTLGLGESYVDGWWDCNALDVLIYKVMKQGAQHKIKITWPVIVGSISSLTRNLQSRSRAYQIGEAHYDIGNDLYKAMLDKRLAYSCGYWQPTSPSWPSHKSSNGGASPSDVPMTLDEAQEAKLDLLCRKLNLQPGQKILDIGCGWGSFIGYAAEKYGVTAVGVTVAKEQIKYAQERYKHLPIEVKLEDYRNITGQFDHVVSVGMFEHVGYKNYREFFKTARRVLKPDGLFLLHTIGSLKSSKSFDPWINKYIFPNGLLPSIAQIARATEGLFVTEDWHSFGAYYDNTLMAWHQNFSKHWPELQPKYGDRFGRMWRYYLLICAGSFRARANQLWQVVLSPHGVEGGYNSVR